MFGLVCLGDPAQNFLGEVAPIIDDPGIVASREVSGVSFETQQTYAPPNASWLTPSPGSTSSPAPASVRSPAFDWQFWNWYCHKYLGANPDGFSARRIGDLDAGRRGEPLNTSAFKKRRETAHTHNPVDDARGNAEALRWILEQMGEKL